MVRGPWKGSSRQSCFSSTATGQIPELHSTCCCCPLEDKSHVQLCKGGSSRPDQEELQSRSDGALDLIRRSSSSFNLHQKSLVWFLLVLKPACSIIVHYCLHVHMFLTVTLATALISSASVRVRVACSGVRVSKAHLFVSCWGSRITEIRAGGREGWIWTGGHGSNQRSWETHFLSALSLIMSEYKWQEAEGGIGVCSHQLWHQPTLQRG